MAMVLGLRVGAGLVFRGNGRAVSGLEGFAPVGAHVLDVVEAFHRVAGQGAPKEGGQGLTDGGVEHLGVERDLAVEDRGIAPAIAPAWQGASGHLVENHAGRKTLGGFVPAGRFAQDQERVQVWNGPGADAVSRRARQGKVEEHEVQSIAAAHGSDADVVGLDVPVGDAVLVQPVKRLQ